MGNNDAFLHRSRLNQTIFESKHHLVMFLQKGRLQPIDINIVNWPCSQQALQCKWEEMSVNQLMLMSVNVQSMGKDECQPVDAFVNALRA